MCPRHELSADAVSWGDWWFGRESVNESAYIYIYIKDGMYELSYVFCYAQVTWQIPRFQTRSYWRCSLTPCLLFCRNLHIQISYICQNASENWMHSSCRKKNSKFQRATLRKKVDRCCTSLFKRSSLETVKLLSKTAAVLYRECPRNTFLKSMYQACSSFTLQNSLLIQDLHWSNHSVWAYFTINDLICSTMGTCSAIILLKSPKKDDGRSYSDKLLKQYCKVFRSFKLIRSMVLDKMVWSHEHCNDNNAWWSSPDLAMSKWS